MFRLELEKRSYYDNNRRIIQVDNTASGLGTFFALPITDICERNFSCFQEKELPFPTPFQGCSLSNHELPLSKKLLVRQHSPQQALQTSLRQILKRSFDDNRVFDLMKDVPKSWEQHGDMVVLPSSSFSSSSWQLYMDSLSDKQTTEFWSGLAANLKCKRIALDSKVSDDDFRSSGVQLLLGTDGWVDHVDNSIQYTFDVTKCMFSSGNITEKLRVASFHCEGETVLDLYAGVGYFVFPYLVHAGAAVVHACEWNPHAVEALKRGLRVNKIEGKCVIHHGDSRKVHNI